MHRVPKSWIPNTVAGTGATNRSAESSLGQALPEAALVPFRNDSDALGVVGAEVPNGLVFR